MAKFRDFFNKPVSLNDTFERVNTAITQADHYTRKFRSQVVSFSPSGRMLKDSAGNEHWLDDIKVIDDEKVL